MTGGLHPDCGIAQLAAVRLGRIYHEAVRETVVRRLKLGRARKFLITWSNRRLPFDVVLENSLREHMLPPSGE